jgi:predicted metal-dependent hydrolase
MYLKYFEGYSETVRDQVSNLIGSGKLKSYLKNKYPNSHNINSDKLLFEYTNDLKQTYMRKAPTLSKVIYQKQKDLITNALGTHSFISRNHGGKLKSKHEIRIAMFLKDAPEEMLQMLVVHELAHFKEKDHNKAFYNLCEHMQPDYHQVELDLRLYLVLLDQNDDLTS